MDNPRAHTESNGTGGSPAQRDEHGRYLKGNRGGAGNPFTRQAARLRRAALEVVSEDDIRDILGTLKAKAKEGDVAAIKLLLSYTVGKPGAVPDPDTLDQHEWATIAGNHVPTPEGLIQIVRGMPVEALLILLRAALPTLFPSKMEMATVAFARAQSMDAQEDGLDEDHGDEDEDGLDGDEDEQAEASAATAADRQQPPATDPVPDWMQALIQRIGRHSGHVAPETVPPSPLADTAMRV